MIYHAVEQHTSVEPRIKRARENWKTFYKKREMIPAHLSTYRFSSRMIGDAKDLPTIKEILAQGKIKAQPDDIILLTNDDTLLHPKLPALIRETVAMQGAVCSKRVNIESGTPFETMSPLELMQPPREDYGRDLFAFTRIWLDEHWSKLPDMFVGEWEWDLILSYMIRKSLGIQSEDLNVRTKAELPLGYVLHERHGLPAWQCRERRIAPAKWWNRAMAKAWYFDNGLQHLFTLG